MFYNTTNELQPELRECWTKAENQDKKVYDFFCQMGGQWIPEDVWDFLVRYEHIGKNTPLTSIRRSITDLTKEGKLIKTETKKIGSYGRANYCWKLAKNQLELF